ncbi:MAG TPA: hypothetical protein VKR56_00375 [Candidatus Cybelea sp.]|nr:hypothetical protein [Candidatus Cybelea sp.]
MRVSVPRRTALVCVAVAALAGCGALQQTQSSALVPGVTGNNATPVRESSVPKVAGVYNGTVTESSQGRSIKAKLKITFRQSGNKLTGIFDIILKTLQDQFPIPKGVVVSSHGKTILHFTIEGSPGRNAKAVARLTGKTLKGKANVSSRNGPAVHFTYTTTKA